MTSNKVLLSCLTVLALGVPSAGVIGCHAEAQAKLGGEQPPPPPAPPLPAVATVEPAPPPAPPPLPPVVVAPKIVALRGVQMKTATQIDMPGDIEFQTASSKIVLNDKSKKVLSQLAQILKDNPEISKLSVEGNTDDEGEKKGYDNVKLSQQRAQSVVEWLVKDGVDAKRLAAVGYGSQHSLAANDSPEHMAQNRRVDFHVRVFNGETVSKDDPLAAPALGAQSLVSKTHDAPAPVAAASATAAAPAKPAPHQVGAQGAEGAKKPPKKDKDK